MGWHCSQNYDYCSQDKFSFQWGGIPSLPDWVHHQVKWNVKSCWTSFDCVLKTYFPGLKLERLIVHFGIIESIDSICRDSVDTQYMLIQKKSLKISKTGFITMYHSSSSAFMTSNTPSGTKNIAKVLNQKVTRWPRCFSFFLLLLLLQIG